MKTLLIITFLIILLFPFVAHLFVGILFRYKMFTILNDLSRRYYDYALSRGRQDDLFQRFMDWLTSLYYDEQSYFCMEIYHSLIIEEQLNLYRFYKDPSFFCKDANFFKYFSRTIRDGLFVSSFDAPYVLHPLLFQHFSKNSRSLDVLSHKLVFPRSHGTNT